MRQLHAGAQRHLHEVRYVRKHDGVFVSFEGLKEYLYGTQSLSFGTQ